MTIYDRLAHLMHDTVIIAPRTGELNGEPVFATDPGDLITYEPCYVKEGPIRYRTNEGDTIIGTGMAICPGAPTCPADGKATLPSGRLAPIEYVDGPYPDKDGVLVVQTVVFG